MATGVSDISADPDYGGATDPDMSPAMAWVHIRPWHRVAVLVTQVYMVPTTSQAVDINTDSGCSRTMDLDMVLGSSLGLHVIVALGGISGHPYWHGHRWCPRPQASSQPLMVRGVIDINTDPKCVTVMDPDMAPGSILCPDITMVLGGSVGLLDLHGPCGGTFLRH